MDVDILHNLTIPLESYILLIIDFYVHKKQEMKMDQNTQDKVKAYYLEAKNREIDFAKGKISPDDVKVQQDDFYNRLNAEPEEVQSSVALMIMGVTQELMVQISKLPGPVSFLVKGLMGFAMPKDLTVTKRDISFVDEKLGDAVPARMAFYHNAIKQLPDVSDDNPKKVVSAMKQTMKNFM